MSEITTDEYIKELERELAVAKQRKTSEEKQTQAKAATEKAIAEQRQAEAATSNAKRELLALQAKISEARAEVEMMAEQKSNLIDEGTERAKVSLVTVKAELDKARQNAAHTRKELARDITDKTATVEQLKKAIERLQANKKELEGANID